MGKKGPRAKTKTVLKSVSKMQQFGSMQNLRFQTFLNKNPPKLAKDLMDSQDPKDLLFCYDLRVFREKYFQPLAVIHKDIHITAIELLEDFFSQ